LQNGSQADNPIKLFKIAENKKKMDKNVLDKIYYKCIIKKLCIVLCVNTTF